MHRKSIEAAEHLKDDPGSGAAGGGGSGGAGSDREDSASVRTDDASDTSAGSVRQQTHPQMQTDEHFKNLNVIRTRRGPSPNDVSPRASPTPNHTSPSNLNHKRNNNVVAQEEQQGFGGVTSDDPEAFRFANNLIQLILKT